MADFSGRARARLVGLVAGRKVYRVPVLVRENDSHLCATVRETWHSVLAFSPVEATNYMRDTMRFRPETEVVGFGVKGGEVYRYVGYESAVWSAMCAGHAKETQPGLDGFEVGQ